MELFPFEKDYWKNILPIFEKMKADPCKSGKEVVELICSIHSKIEDPWQIESIKIFSDFIDEGLKENEKTLLLQEIIPYIAKLALKIFKIN